MSFLKKLGIVLAQVGATAVGLGPIVAPLFGSNAGKVAQGISSVVNNLTQVATIIAQIEVALSGKEGVEKFRAAVALVGPIIRTSELVSGKKIADEVLFQKGVQGITQGVVDVLNALKAESVDKEVKSGS